MAFCSSGVSARLSPPTVAMRSAPWPTNWTTLTEVPRPRKWSRYSPKLCQVADGLLPMPPIQLRTASCMPGAMGPGEKPHMPTTSVVTPWRPLDEAEGRVSYPRSEWGWLSTTPGVTINSVASITRAASPESPRPIAVIRSPSTATSAATPGAPLPSITVPPLMRSDQAIGLLGEVDDLHGLHLVALLDVVHDVHARGNLAEDGVLAVEEVRGGERDVELASRGVGILAPCHGHHAAIVLLLVALRLDLVAGAARAVALGIAALHHESGLYAMEGEPVVEALLGEGDEVLDGLRRVLGEEFDLDGAALLHGDLGDLFHARGSFRLSGFGSLGPRAGRHDE